ncbi:MAG: prephenate dehydrogenase [Planctomycetaceae bacterium]|jgi:prephenate dehydrogenase|nr:prephenate dehydrogenase [Planctomycetaceae bacterium]
MKTLSKILIIGTGLIGASIGLAAKRAGVADCVVGVGRRQTNLDAAIERGAVDYTFCDLADAIRHDTTNNTTNTDELIIVCTPVGSIVEQVRNAASLVKQPTLITDAGSTKSAICEQLADTLPNSCRFVGSHPIAGSERGGAAAGLTDLFDNRTTIITPSANSFAADVSLLENFWQALGSRTVIMNPQSHDRVLSRTSHLPHLLAATLTNLLTPHEREFVGTGFLDMTRIASGSPTMWHDIVAANAEMILDACSSIVTNIEQLKSYIEAADYENVTKLLERAKTVRDELGR